MPDKVEHKGSVVELLSSDIPCLVNCIIVWVYVYINTGLLLYMFGHSFLLHLYFNNTLFKFLYLQTDLALEWLIYIDQIFMYSNKMILCLKEL